MVQHGSNGVCLDSAAHKRGAVHGGSRGRLLALDELLLAVGTLRPAVGFAKEWCEDGNVRGVVEDGTESNRRRLDGREVVDGKALK